MVTFALFLRKNGIGTSVGRIMLATIDYLKPDLSAPLVKPQLTLEQMQEEAKKPPPLKSFQHFKKARKTTEEMFNEISNNANININTWMNLIGKPPPHRLPPPLYWWCL